jgi:hypothetical protein
VDYPDPIGRISVPRDIVKDFLSRLHTDYFKARGYRKQGHTFMRDLKGFTERIQFQGSAWNSKDSSWCFYVNFGVQFHVLLPRSLDRDLPGTHCWGRIESIVPEAPAEFELVGEDDRLVRDLAAYLERASERLADEIEPLRRRYEEKRVPRLWLG